MNFRILLLSWLLIVVGVEAQSADYGLIQRYFANQTGFLPVEGAELEAVPLNGNSLDSRGFVFRSKDSIYLYATKTICPLCVGCQCGFSNPQRLAVVPIDSVHSGLPLQKIARVWGRAAPNYTSPRSLHFLITHSNRLFLYTYQVPPPNSSNPTTLQRVDSASIVAAPPLAGRFVLGIDTFHLASFSTSIFQLRMFGQRGWFGSAYFQPGQTTTVQAPSVGQFPDSLDICASGEGYYGTLGGQILDPTLGFANPLKVSAGAIAVVNVGGAVGDSGLFVLHEWGRWRPYRLGAGSLRNFSIIRIGPNNSGAWGTRGNFWDNRFQLAFHFVKDDSTIWTDDRAIPAKTVSKDSNVSFTSTPGSAILGILDSDSNYSHPEISFSSQSSGAIPLTGIWGNFAKGCGAGANIIITCYPASSRPYFRVDWDSSAVRLISGLRRGRWETYAVLYPFFALGHRFIDSTPLPLDTLIPWSPGDTLRVQFSNASYNLFNASPVAIPSSGITKAAFHFRVVGREIQWNTSSSNTLSWSLSDLSGRPILRGQTEPGSGKIRIPANTRGIRFLTFTDLSSRRILWKGRIFIP